MKKLHFVIAFLIFGFTTSVQSQEMFNFGVKGGVNFANLNGDDIDDSDMRTSFHIGVLAEIYVTDRFSVQPEVMYSGQGLEYSGEGTDITWKLDYVNVPVLAKFYLVEALSLEVGPQIGFNVTSEVEMDGDTTDIDDVESVDFSGAFGLGYTIADAFMIQGRYNLGFTDVIKDVDMKNGVIQLSVGYKF